MCVNVSGGSEVVKALYLHGNKLFVGGSFETARNLMVPSVPVSNIAMWELNQDWHQLGLGTESMGVEGEVRTLLSKDGTGEALFLYVGGEFTNAINGDGTNIQVNV